MGSPVDWLSSPFLKQLLNSAPSPTIFNLITARGAGSEGDSSSGFSPPTSVDPVSVQCSEQCHCMRPCPPCWRETQLPEGRSLETIFDLGGGRIGQRTEGHGLPVIGAVRSSSEACRPHPLLKSDPLRTPGAARDGQCHCILFCHWSLGSSSPTFGPQFPPV